MQVVNAMSRNRLSLLSFFFGSLFVDELYWSCKSSTERSFFLFCQRPTVFVFPDRFSTRFVSLFGCCSGHVPLYGPSGNTAVFFLKPLFYFHWAIEIPAVFIFIFVSWPILLLQFAFVFDGIFSVNSEHKAWLGHFFPHFSCLYVCSSWRVRCFFCSLSLFFWVLSFISFLFYC